jgi:hypothetical protein
MDWENRRYSEEEVSAIIKRALQGTSAQTITHDELLEIAQKSGVSPDKLADAIERHEELADLERAKQRWIRLQRQDFRGHLIAYVIVNGALALMNFMTTGYPWVLWPILGWGIGLAFHAVDTFMVDDEKLERGARRLLKKERRQQRRAERTGQYSGN